MTDLSTLLSPHGIALDQENVATGGSALVHRGHVEDPTRWALPAGAAVAIKQYRSEVLKAPGQRERIRQEASVGKRLQHPNVVRTLELIESPEAEGTWFLIQEWIDGTTLEQWHAAAEKPIPWETIRLLCNNLLAAVAALHEQKVFHRDIKPENIMVSAANNAAILMDVGVAEIADGSDYTLHTSLKDFIGTVRYASPQFVRGEQYTTADDVYGLGATFVLLFTGRSIFDQVSRKPLISAAVLDPSAKRFGTFESEVPQPLVPVLRSCLHHDSRRRPTISELRDAINDPAGSSFVTTALAREQDDAQGFPVIELIAGSKGREFYVDIGDAELNYDEVFTVVRRSRALKVPSVGREVQPEQWIAEAIFKHSRQGVGYFRVYHRHFREVSRQQPSPMIEALVGQFSSFQPTIKTGEWIVEGDEPKDVQRNDIVLRSRSTSSGG